MVRREAMESSPGIADATTDLAHSTREDGSKKVRDQWILLFNCH